MKILIDADNSGRIRQIEKIARRYRIPVILFCDQSRNLESTYSSVVLCDSSYDSADFALLNKCEKGDIVVTRDIGLAGIALAKGAKVIHSSGRILSNNTIDAELERRAIKQKMRRNSKHYSQARKAVFGYETKQKHNFSENLIKLILQSVKKPEAKFKVELRKMKPEDADDLFRFWKHPDVQFFLSLSDYFADKMQEWLNGLKDGNRGYMIVETKSAAVIGVTGLIVKEDCGEIWLALYPEYRGKGYGTDTVYRLLGIAKGKGMERVMATVEESNESCIRLLEKLGFSKYEPALILRVDPQDSLEFELYRAFDYQKKLG